VKDQIPAITAKELFVFSSRTAIEAYQLLFSAGQIP
jgi:hypothetical protein